MQTEAQRRASREVEHWLARHGRSNQWLAAQARVDKGTVGDFLTGQRWPIRATLAKIETALGWPVGQTSAIAEGAPAPADDTGPAAPRPEILRAAATEERMIDVLEVAMTREGLSVAQLARRLGWSADELGDRLEGRADFRVREYLAVCDALGLDAFSVSLTLGLSDEVPERELGGVRVEDRRE